MWRFTISTYPAGVDHCHQMVQGFLPWDSLLCQTRSQASTRSRTRSRCPSWWTTRTPQNLGWPRRSRRVSLLFQGHIQAMIGQLQDRSVRRAPLHQTKCHEDQDRQLGGRASRDFRLGKLKDQGSPRQSHATTVTLTSPCIGAGCVACIFVGDALL